MRRLSTLYFEAIVCAILGGWEDEDPHVQRAARGRCLLSSFLLAQLAQLAQSICVAQAQLAQSFCVAHAS